MHLRASGFERLNTIHGSWGPGMTGTATRWLMSSVKGTLIEALQDNPRCSLKVVGEYIYKIYAKLSP